MTAAAGGVSFRETQRFIQKWVWAIVLLLLIGMWVMGLLWFFFDRPEDPNLLSDVIVAFSWALAGVGIPVLLLVMKLETEVRPDGLYVRYFPFHLQFRRFAWSEIRESGPRRYDPMREYGGWGIRWGKGGRAYNASGDRGLQLVLAGGKRWLIGSQRADGLAAAVDAAMASRVKGGIR